MKKHHVTCLLTAGIVAFLYSCSAAHKIQGVNLNGNWLLTSVNVEGGATNNKFKTTLFNDVPSECLNNSTWSLMNSGNGSYTIQAGLPACTPGARPIYWSVRNENGVNYFQFKQLESSTKPKNVQEGYRMEVTSATDSTLVLRSPANVENQTVYVVYNFTRQ